MLHACLDSLVKVLMKLCLLFSGLVQLARWIFWRDGQHFSCSTGNEAHVLMCSSYILWFQSLSTHSLSCHLCLLFVSVISTQELCVGLLTDSVRDEKKERNTLYRLWDWVHTSFYTTGCIALVIVVAFNVSVYPKSTLVCVLLLNRIYCVFFVCFPG